MVHSVPVTCSYPSLFAIRLPATPKLDPTTLLCSHSLLCSFLPASIPVPLRTHTLFYHPLVLPSPLLSPRLLDIKRQASPRPSGWPARAGPDMAAGDERWAPTWPSSQCARLTGDSDRAGQGQIMLRLVPHAMSATPCTAPVNSHIWPSQPCWASSGPWHWHDTTTGCPGLSSRLVWGLHTGRSSLGDTHGLCLAMPQHMLLMNAFQVGATFNIEVPASMLKVWKIIWYSVKSLQYWR